MISKRCRASIVIMLNWAVELDAFGYVMLRYVKLYQY